MNQLLIGTKNPGKFKEIKSILGKLSFKLIPVHHLKNIPKILGLLERSDLQPSIVGSIISAKGGSASGMTLPLKLPTIKETGRTYQANALQKARILFKTTGLPVLAEDSGLEVKVLGNKPGIHSARYSGEVSTESRLFHRGEALAESRLSHRGEAKSLQDKLRPDKRRGKNATPERNNKKLLKELAGVPLNKRSARYKCVAVLIIPITNNLQRTTRLKVLISEGVCNGKIALVPKGRNGFGYDPLFIPDGYKKTFGNLSERIKNRISHRAKALRKLIIPIKGIFKW